MVYIKWCSCGRQILTTGQIERNEPCEACQKEHAKTLKERSIIKEEEQEFNG